MQGYSIMAEYSESVSGLICCYALPRILGCCSQKHSVFNMQAEIIVFIVTNVQIF